MMLRRLVKRFRIRRALRALIKAQGHMNMLRIEHVDNAILALLYELRRGE